ncbi:unnamed protein product, partial [Closterium sp. NIES-53]
SFLGWPLAFSIPLPPSPIPSPHSPSPISPLHLSPSLQLRAVTQRAPDQSHQKDLPAPGGQAATTATESGCEGAAVERRRAHMRAGQTSRALPAALLYVPCHAMPCPANHALPCHAVLFHAVPCHAV